MTVDWDYDTSVDFSTLKTYAWLDQPVQSADPRTRNSLLDERVKNAVDTELNKKGLVRSEPGSSQAPDCLLAWHVTVDRKLAVDTFDYGRGYYWGPGHATETRVREYEEGTLIVDVLKPEKPQLIWRGSATARVRPSLSPEQRTAQIREAAQRIFEPFPPGVPAP